MEQVQLQRNKKIQKRSFEPPMLKVVILNDDITTYDFVVRVLQEVFFKSPDQAFALAVETDTNGSAIVGTYTEDIALSKVDLATSMARQEGFPLRFKTENV